MELRSSSSSNVTLIFFPDVKLLGDYNQRKIKSSNTLRVNLLH